MALRCNRLFAIFQTFFFVKIECGLYFLDRFDVLISKIIFKKWKNIISMLFGTKNYLKINSYHTLKYAFIKRDVWLFKKIRKCFKHGPFWEESMYTCNDAAFDLSYLAIIPFNFKTWKHDWIELNCILQGLICSLPVLLLPSGAVGFMSWW